MKNNKAVLSLLVIATLFIFGFLTNQVFTQLSSRSLFGNRANVSSTDLTLNSKNGGGIVRPVGGRGGGNTDGPGGWTTITPTASAQFVYLSTTGSDSANCVYTGPNGTRPYGGSDFSNPTNAITPCSSLSNGYSRIRNGQNDFLLFKRGDTWNGQAIGLNKDGASPTAPIVFASWSPASSPSTVRPQLNVTGGTVFNSNSFRRNLAFLDLHLMLNVGPTSPVDGSSGIYMSASDVLFENMQFERFGIGLIVTADYGGRPSNISIRRNIFNDSFCSNRCTGMLTAGDHYLVEGNVYDHNGMIGNLNGYTSSIFNHNAYMSYNSGDVTDAVITDNFLIRGASGGKFGSTNGGTIQNNFFAENSISVLECCEDGQILRNNVIIGGLDLNSVDKRGVGIDIGNSRNVTVDNNILAHQQRGTDNAEGFWIGTTANTSITNNVFYDWCLANSTGFVGFALLFNNSNPSSLTISNNQFQQKCQSGQQGRVYKGSPIGPTYRNNVYYVDAGTTGIISSPQGYVNSAPPTYNYAQWVAASGETGSSFSQISYLDPNRDAATYMTSLGLGTYAFGSQAGLDAFAARLRQYSKWNDDPRFSATAINDYIRCGFNKAPLSGSCTGGGNPDTQPPQVSITAPVNNATVSGTTVIIANASDNIAVTRVEFYRDGTLLGADTTAPYSYSWNTIGTPQGAHTLTAKAYDAVPNIGTSQPVNVTVNNGISAFCQTIDRDGNGMFNANDFSSFINQFQANDMSTDMDGNGILNANDFQRFLNGYAQCHG